jgi:hypothetical protein
MLIGPPSGGIHDGAHVVHSLLEGGEHVYRDSVREAGAPFVEQNQPAERGEAVEKMGEIGIFPGLFDMRNKARHVDEIERAVPDDLVGDAVVVAFGIARRRSHRAHSAGIISSHFQND